MWYNDRIKELEDQLSQVRYENTLMEQRLQQLLAKESQKVQKETSKLAKAFGWACGFIMFSAALVVTGVVVQWLYTRMSQPMDIIVTSVAIGIIAAVMRGVALGKLDL